MEEVIESWGEERGKRGKENENWMINYPRYGWVYLPILSRFNPTTSD